MSKSRASQLTAYEVELPRVRKIQNDMYFTLLQKAWSLDPQGEQPFQLHS